MLEKAIKKIKDEMGKDKNQYVQVVGGFLLEYVANDPTAAEKILDDKKTIASSLNVMMKEAEKKRVGNGAVLAYEEGLDIVLKYFDIKKKTTEVKEDKAEEKVIDINSVKQKKIEEETEGLSSSLDHYLGF